MFVLSGRHGNRRHFTTRLTTLFNEVPTGRHDNQWEALSAA